MTFEKDFDDNYDIEKFSYIEMIEERKKLGDITNNKDLELCSERKYQDGSDNTFTTTSFDITFIEFAMINRFLFSSYHKRNSANINIHSYGTVDSIGRISFSNEFDPTQGWWFIGNYTDDDEPVEYIFQTKILLDSTREIITKLQISVKTPIKVKELDDAIKRIKKIAFNHSEYVGKCIRVKLRGGDFKGIDVIDLSTKNNVLILTPVQRKYIEYFIKRVRNGKQVRYLLNGDPGCGKTQSIREIMNSLIPDVTFIIPEFSTTEDLSIILESCEIFEKAVICIDDIDLYLGSRDKGTYSKMLGEFLSFFDGINKRKVSLLASTNDKGLVDKAAERPGRFNLTLDYTYLTPEQIKEVCKVHLSQEFCVDEVYNMLSSSIDGKTSKITGAFIANLAENIKEMSDGDTTWGLKETLDLIDESYRGFYSSQTKKYSGLGFNDKK